MKIYHNPRCTKSRETLALIQEAGIEPEIVEYLKTPITKRELGELLARLNLSPIDIVRKGEAEYKEKYKGLALNDAEWMQILVDNPKLIERPIVVKGNRAVLGRPPENVKALL